MLPKHVKGAQINRISRCTRFNYK